MRMFSRKKNEDGPGLWDAVDAKQKEYAHRLADWLGQRTAEVPARRMRAWVIGALVGLALVNTVNMVVAIRGHHDKNLARLGSIKAATLPAPRIVSPPRARQWLERYLDSLRRDSTGSRLLDSLLKARPGLADSLNEVERMEP